jgi:DNA-binding NarL/FixJ family response regulator
MQTPAWACDHPTMRRTVLIVDDHEEFRSSAGALLDAEGFDVVGEAPDGPTAIEAVARLRPDVVLLDIQLPGPDGLTVAEQLAGTPDPPAVVLISSRDAAAYGPRLTETPARGFIQKAALSGEAITALLE